MNTITKYILLITQFVTRKITSVQFETAYLDMFKKETEILPENTYDVLNNLFLDVESYCGDPNLRDEDDLDDKDLLASAKKALEKL